MATWESIFKRKGKVFKHIQEDMKKVISFLKKEKVTKVLDLGCGSGRHTVLLSKYGFDVHATDISQSGLNMTKKSLREENLSAILKKHSCYKRFPFKDNSFDAVLSTQVIHHNFHDKVKFCISQIERVLKQNGIIFITVSANRSRGQSRKVANPQPRTYIPLDGYEKGLPHYIYNKALIQKDFKNFEILDIHKDEGNHYCILGRLRKS